MRRTPPFVLLAVIAAAAIAWWFSRDPELAPHAAANAGAPNAVVPASANVIAPRGDVADEARREHGSPATAVDLNAATKGLQLRVRLRGLHAQATWTAPLILRLKGRDEPRDQWLSFDASVAPDRDGKATFAVPDWCVGASQQKGRLEARDPNYQRVQQRWDAACDLAHELVVDVQVVGVLTGRVIDHAGQPVAPARVVAFAVRDGQPVEPVLASTNTRDDGSYRLPAPPEKPVWLLAAPMQRAGGREGADEDGGVRDDGDLRDDLLPAAATATARIGEPTTVPDFVLAPAARITGSVKWADGEAVDGAQVWATPIGSEPVPLQSGANARASLRRDAEGRLSPHTVRGTDARGEFVLPAVAGVTYEVRLLGVTRGPTAITQFQPQPSQQAVAPQRVEFLVPRPVVLRAIDRDAPVTGASLEIDGEASLQSFRRPEFRLVVTTPLRVRAIRERMRSPWREIGPADAGATIDLVMSSERVPVSIEFDGDFRVRNTIITWHRDDGVEGREHLLRDDRPGAFQIFLERGRYHLTAGPGGGERNGVFLLPCEHDVDVGAEPVSLRLPALFGGTFTVMATDSSGLYVGGRCELHDRAGAQHEAIFRLEGGANGRTGELLPGGPNLFTRVLPPGDYELMCDFGALGAQRAIVTIRARETSEVRVRLP